MKMICSILILSIISLITCEHKNNWAVLTSGSDGWWNYRHQSDVYHAYQILLRNGYNPDHIIVFAPDDIAYHVNNPLPGQIFNYPDGDNVYEGVKIDYKGKDVTAKNYLKVMKGDKVGMTGIGTGRVLESTKEDNVFMYFADHGSDHMICFPDDLNLFADELFEALKYMHDNQMYNKLVYYLEACHSGSMFQNFPHDMNIYAVTASDYSEMAGSIYCNLESFARGELLRVCLSDEFSAKWMNDTEVQTNPGNYTLREQYESVRRQMTLSHPMQYGDLRMGINETIKNFLFFDNKIKQRISKTNYEGSKINARNAKLEYLRMKAEESGSLVDRNVYENEIAMIEKSKKIFSLFRAKLNIPNKRTSMDIDYDCLKLSIAIFKDLCGYDERDIAFIHDFTTACSIQTSKLNIYTTLKDICKSI